MADTCRGSFQGHSSRASRTMARQLMTLSDMAHGYAVNFEIRRIFDLDFASSDIVKVPIWEFARCVKMNKSPY
jgi:hypothetical protein